MANYMLISKYNKNFWSMRPLKNQKVGKDSHLSVQVYLEKIPIFIKTSFYRMLFWMVNTKIILNNGCDQAENISELRCF